VSGDFKNKEESDTKESGERTEEEDGGQQSEAKRLEEGKGG